MSDLKKTPLHAWHVEQKARMVPFGGWDMPVNYISLIEEHNWVRDKAGLFDVSHMGEVTVSGKQALDFLQTVTCNDIAKVGEGRVQYNALINDKTGVVDDITVYGKPDGAYLLCINAANIDKDFAFLEAVAKDFDVIVKNDSAAFGQIAVQGPAAKSVVPAVAAGYGFDADAIASLKYYTFVEKDGHIISRTGYTGEDGYEWYTPAAGTQDVWSKLAESDDVKPIGLGARDTLRLEAKYPLYGHELRDDWTIVEGGQGWIVKDKSPAPAGHKTLLSQKADGPSQKIIGFILLDPGVARADYVIYNTEEKKIGTVTSGTHSPTLGKSIGLAMVSAPIEDGTDIFIEVRGKKKKAQVHLKPFIETRAGKL